jgi:tetratricopeptide (TPR) repeat protein
MTKKRGTVASALLAFALAAVRAGADTAPSTWNLAEDPGLRARWSLHTRVERILDLPDIRSAAGDPSPERMAVQWLQEHWLEKARAMLEDADAAHSADPRLVFDLGLVYERLATLERRNDLHRKVVEVLQPALDKFPDHPASLPARSALVDSLAKLNRPREELTASQRYIPQLLDDRSRIVPLMNMGEAQMRLGLLDEALATFREVLSLCERLPNGSSVNGSSVNFSYALALWDLAVALDRSADAAGALRAATRARAWAWYEVAGARLGRAAVTVRVTGWDAIHDEETVFFVPDWEREWYFALGESAAAIGANDPRDESRFWAAAEHHWEVYLAHSVAAGASDRWAPLARARLGRARAARSDADRRAAKPRSHARAAEGPWAEP